MIDYAALRTRLYVRRVALGLTQRELADRAGITQSMISDYERGLHIPTLPTLDKWVAALKLESNLDFSPVGQQTQRRMDDEQDQMMEQEQEQEPDRLYDSREARELLGGISEAKFRQLTKTGELPAKKQGSRVYIPRSVIVEYIAALQPAFKGEPNASV